MRLWCLHVFVVARWPTFSLCSLFLAVLLTLFLVAVLKSFANIREMHVPLSLCAGVVQLVMPAALRPRLSTKENRIALLGSVTYLVLQLTAVAKLIAVAILAQTASAWVAGTRFQQRRRLSLSTSSNPRLHACTFVRARACLCICVRAR